ncbi:hypothetical protein FALBO_13034 [Fusarium albosuccineum]|uniref:Uncharacterized protein n=1 Tax=Fusarium albosuccineum TaxID=1237068 RepID=A0A8H4L296_9HYPO|nr:hypothetical protein FALBO_13034 [Fusarium albosuccineum]
MSDTAKSNSDKGTKTADKRVSAPPTAKGGDLIFSGVTAGTTDTVPDQKTKGKEVASSKEPAGKGESAAHPDGEPDKKEAERQRKMDAMRRKAEEAKAKVAVEAMNRMSLFDSTQASSWELTGTHSLGAMKAVDGSIIISGRNIGAEQKEPDWTEEQRKAIAIAKSTELMVRPVNNTRVSVMDDAMEFVGRDEMGTLVPTERAYASSLAPSEYLIGIGPEKFDVTGSPRFYADVVLADINGTWLSNQWTSEGVVIEGLAANVLMQQNKPGNTSGRRIGHHFARIGLPAYAFGPLFYTLGSKFEGCLAQVTQTTGYYWLNASWGVTSFNAVFSYLNDDGELKKEQSLVNVMRMLDGKSSLSLATVAISITCAAKMVDGKPTPDRNVYGLSVKLHNAFGVDVVDFHGPSQQGSTGLSVPARIAKFAKPMGRSKIVQGTGTGSIFATGASPFAQAGNTAPVTKSSTTKSYM